LNPLDSFKGAHRLLSDLEAALGSGNFNEFSLATAFASSAPFKHLASPLAAFRANGGRCRAMIGIDRAVTSLEALELALQLFDDVYIVHTTAPNSIFHPKLYLFRGSTSARCFIGSNNFTTGGTQTNMELALDLTFTLPAETNSLGPFLKPGVIFFRQIR
jgi:HKD family nuclease